MTRKIIAKCAISLFLLLAIFAIFTSNITLAQFAPGFEPGQNSNQVNIGNNFGMNNNSLSPNASINNLLPANLGQSSGGTLSNIMTSISNNPNVISANTVLTGVLQEDISSKKSKTGDIFSIMLPEDYIVNDRTLIPQYAKFVGTIVSAAPTTSHHHGNPGTVEISIQTLVAPNGTSVPVEAFIEYDPNQTKANVAKSRGIPAGEWGKSAIYSLHYLAGSFGGRMGVPILYKGQTGKGKDLSLSEGDLLAVKLTQPLDVTPFISVAKPLNTQSQNLFAAPTNSSNLPPVTPTGNENNIMPDTNTPAGPEPF